MPVTITPDRLTHILHVARTAAAIAKRNGLNAQRAFVLGFLHDIGYEYAANQAEHHTVGALMLHDAGLPLDPITAVGEHGCWDVDITDDWVLLNAADMCTGPQGQRLTFTKRLDDIAARYGRDSTQYTNAAKVIDAVRTGIAKRGWELP